MKRFIQMLIVVCTIAVVTGIMHRSIKAPDEDSVIDNVIVSPEETEIPEEVKPEVYEASLFFAGDGLIHGAVYWDARDGEGGYNFDEMLEPLRSMVEKYDLAYYNQETILGGSELGLSSYPQFNSPQEFGDTMVGLGFNLVSTATNHSLDVGVLGIEKSKEYWNAQEGVIETGTFLSQEEHDAIPVYEINGITYTFLSYTYGCNGLLPPEGMEYIVNIYTGEEEKLLETIRKADQLSDVVIMAMHWGIEYYMDVSEEQETLAKAMAEAGADIIIGNHPHVIEPAEWIGDTICFYAMGNTISAQLDLENLIGMVGGLKIVKTVTDGNTEVHIEDVRADLIYTYYAEGYTNFKVYPFSELDDSILWNYEEIYEQFKEVITRRDSSIQVGGV